MFNPKDHPMKTLLKKAVLELLDEYIAEGEHQDGEGYWNQFTTKLDVLEDFLLYGQGSVDDPSQNDE